MGYEKRHRQVPLSSTDLDAYRGVYVITTEDRYPCKIGITNDLPLRLSMLQCGNWEKLVPVYFAFAFKPGLGGARERGFNAVRRSAEAFERVAHETLTDIEVTRLVGEWFDIDAADAIAALQKIADVNDYKLLTIDKILRFDPTALTFVEEKAALHDMKWVAAAAESVIVQVPLTPE